MRIPEVASQTMLSCKAKTQYLFALHLSRYCLRLCRAVWAYDGLVSFRKNDQINQTELRLTRYADDNTFAVEGDTNIIRIHLVKYST